MGDRLHAPREANPKGFFEDVEVNSINEDLLAQVVPPPPPVIGRWLFRDRPSQSQRWLAKVPVGTPIPCPPAIAERIQAQVRHQPYCFKDPRFSYTLPAWRPFLNDTVFVCVFRDPASTALSILKECHDAAYLHSLRMTFVQAVEVWTLMYRWILEIHSHEGAWLFIHYNQVVQGDALDRLQALVGAPVDRTFPEASLRRTVSDRAVPRTTQQVYDELCLRAGYAAEILA